MIMIKITGTVEVLFNEYYLKIFTFLSANTVAADGLALKGARSSAGIMMNKFKSCWNMGWYLMR